MPDLPRPDNVLELLRVGPRLAAVALRLTGATLRGLADLIDPGPDGDGTAGAGHPAEPPEPAAGPDRDHADGDRLWDGRDEGGGAPPPPPAAEERPAGQPPVPGPPPAEHVSEDPVLVAEVADAGAEGGPGPEIHVEEPWSGYSEMTAVDIIDRLAAEPAETLAVIELYEPMHRRRRSVLQAAERELRRRGGPAARPS
jgi:hypothetical protein